MLTRLQMFRGISMAAFAAVFAFSAAAQAAPKESKAKARGGGGGGGDFCASSWREGESLAKNGKLRAAMEWMLKCAQVTCKPAIRQECTSRVSKIEADIPSVVPTVTDSSGKTMSEVQVVMDGELLASRIDGRGIPVDPGEHEFVFKTDKETLGSQKALVSQGQRNVAVALNLSGAPAAVQVSSEAAPAGQEAAVATSSEEPSSKPEASSSGGGPGFGTYALGVLGLAGVGGYGLLTYWGNKDNNLLSACSPDCKPESLDHIRKLYLAGKVSLGVGVAALAGATILFLTSGSSSSKEVASNRSNFRFDVAPTAAGGFAAFSGSF